MATKGNSICKWCRREGVSLCGRERCAVKRRNYAPGVHGNDKKQPKLSGYARQLREKQKAKRLYLILERQFRRYFALARGRKGNTAETLVQLLERRMDNAVYRLGLAKTRRQARQMVGHGFFTVNGKALTIPSYLVCVGDVLAVKETKRGKTLTREAGEAAVKARPPKWLSFDAASLSGKMVSLPEKEDLETVFDPTLIVELYSR